MCLRNSNINKDHQNIAKKKYKTYSSSDFVHFLQFFDKIMLEIIVLHVHFLVAPFCQ